MVISRIIALVYDPVKPCFFNSQVNIYLDDFQLSKTVFILPKFYPNKLFKSVDKGRLILVPHSDLFRPRDFYGFDRYEIYRIFCPFSAKMQDEGFNFFMLSPAKIGHFFLNLLCFRWPKHKYYLVRVWWMFKFNGLKLFKLFCQV